MALGSRAGRAFFGEGGRRPAPIPARLEDFSGLTAAPKTALLAIVKYIGGKNQLGTAARIINQIPPHAVYIEPFLGSGAILRLKRPAERSFGVDLVPALFPALRTAATNTALLQGCGISFLEYYPWTGREMVYCDPPYLLATRGGREYYLHEMTDADHARLLCVIKSIPAMVMISGYAHPMYDSALASWRRETFTAYTRTHAQRTEVLWMNYPLPKELHDDRYVGGDFRERWALEKQRRNLVRKFLAMPEAKRAALFSALVDAMGTTGPTAQNGVNRSAHPTAPAAEPAPATRH